MRYRALPESSVEQPCPVLPAPTVQKAAAKAGAAASVGVDSLLSSSAAILANAASAAYLGQTPSFWGRYFYAPGQINSSGRLDNDHYAAKENGFLRLHNIRLLPIARQTGNVGGDAAIGAADAKNNVDSFFDILPPVYLSGADPDVLFFLDVEENRPLSVEYYKGWAATLITYANQVSAGRVHVHPAMYASQGDVTSWTALSKAMAAGAVCDGAWVARYFFPTPAPRGWNDHLVTPAVNLACPILAWQYWESPDHAPSDQNFDTNLINPAHADMLLSRLVMPPPQTSEAGV